MKLKDWIATGAPAAHVPPKMVFEWVKTGHWSAAEFYEWVAAGKKEAAELAREQQLVREFQVYHIAGKETIKSYATEAAAKAAVTRYNKNAGYEAYAQKTVDIYI